MRRLGSCTLLAGLSFVSGTGAVAQTEGPTLAYRVTAEMDGNPGGEWTVLQGPELAVARWPDESASGDVALVSGPAIGGLPAEPLDDMGGLLGVLFDRGLEVEPGYRKESSYGAGTAIVDSVRLALEKGTADETIAGHSVTHHVLTARVWWRHEADDGSVTPVVDEGVAELWFAPDLPFSWIPLAVSPSRPALALPLSFTWPEVAQMAALRFESQFRELGLLLRARTHDESRPAENEGAEMQLMGNAFQASVEVADIQTTGLPPDPAEFSTLARLPHSRVVPLQLLGFLLDPCRSLASGDGGSAELAIEGGWTNRTAEGSAQIVTEEPGEASYAVVAGSMGSDGGTCTLAFLPGDEPRVGAFAITSPTGLGVPDGAIAIHVSSEGPDSRRVVVLEEGEVRIEEAGARQVKGWLEGRGWGIASRPHNPPEVFENLKVTLTFATVPSSPRNE